MTAFVDEMQPDWTVAQGAAWFWDQTVNKGNRALCKCCKRHTQVYKRQLNTPMVCGLVYMIDQYNDNQTWVDMRTESPKEIIQHNTWGLLRYWGMVVKKPRTENEKNRGFWLPTNIGFQFALGEIRVPSCMYVMDDTVILASDETVNAEEAFYTGGDKYEELMDGYKDRLERLKSQGFWGVEDNELD